MFYCFKKNSLLVKDDEARNVILVLLFDDGVEPCGSPPLINAFQLEFPADGAAKSRTRKDSILQLECDGRPHLNSEELAAEVEAGAVELPANRKHIPRIDLGILRRQPVPGVKEYIKA